MGDRKKGTFPWFQGRKEGSNMDSTISCVCVVCVCGVCVCGVCVCVCVRVCVCMR